MAPEPTPGPPAPRRRTTVVLNAGSRSGAAARDRLPALLARHDLADARVLSVTSGAELAATLERALAEGPDLIVVGGGDGSVSCAADRVAGSDVVLGVLPLGTANDFARTLEIPSALEQAVEHLATGKVVDVDLGRCDGRGFLNVASLGLSVGVTQRLRPGLKKRLGPLAYPVATLGAYRGHEPFTARLEFPDGDHDTLALHDLMQVAVGNGRHYGGGNAVAPNASVDDHLLDVYAIERGRLRDHVSIARFLKDGSFVEHEKVHHLTTRRVRVVTDEPLPVNLDGEIAATTPATFEVQRNALHVVVPQTSRAAELDGPRAAAADQG
ncbi:lipid kinase [Nocardioides sp. P86]|uniref:lipid kinase n=1 Tax=Nocardioides sp. P86 TaxID=2939569 RepID=UPI00203A7CF1|nr:lipid kinase [Nocardioides sp. P86]MCM3517033.1 lipid kinase [Nocardioides sp. P86]